MDKYIIFNRGHLPYYQWWIRKVTGRAISVKPADMGWAVKVTNGFIEQDHVHEWFNSSIAWAHRRTIRVRCEYLEGRCESIPFSTYHVRALMLHEAGHILMPRRYHGKAGGEYVADMWALRKASLLGLEAEAWTIRFYMSVCRTSRNRNERIAYRMHRRAGVV